MAECCRAIADPLFRSDLGSVVLLKETSTRSRMSRTLEPVTSLSMDDPFPGYSQCVICSQVDDSADIGQFLPKYLRSLKVQFVRNGIFEPDSQLIKYRRFGMAVDRPTIPKRQCLMGCSSKISFLTNWTFETMLE